MTRVRYLFSPWWRVVWLVGGIAWLIGFNVAYLATGADHEWLGVISVVPVLAQLIDVIVRDRRWQQRAPATGGKS